MLCLQMWCSHRVSSGRFASQRVRRGSYQPHMTVFKFTRLPRHFTTAIRRTSSGVYRYTVPEIVDVINISFDTVNPR